MALSIRRLLLLTLFSAAAFAQPTARTGGRAVFQEDTATIVLFGGLTPIDSSQLRYGLGDTWEWVNRRWVRLLPPDSPPSRGEHIMIYDSNRDYTLIFGGATILDLKSGDRTLVSDTWVFDNGNWSQLDTPSSPPARRLAGAAFDPIRDRVVLFGGFAADNASLFDTWEFDGTTWTLANADGPHLTNPNLVYDPPHNELLMLGVGEDAKAQMHRWNGSSWERLSPTAIPECVAQGALVYHSLSGRVIHYGGLCSSGFPSGETWQWDHDGSTWGRVDASPTAGAVFGMAAAYDWTRHEIILFGGDSFGAQNNTYRFVPDRWLIVENGSTPGPRSLALFEADPVRNVIWLYGGQNESRRFNDLWSWAHGRWDRVVVPDAPAACDSPAGAFDKDRQRLVMLCEDSNVFEFDGSKWYKFENLSTKPPVRRWSSMVYDERNRRVTMFGGFDGDWIRETWVWNGTAWTRIKPNSSPPSRALAMMFFDPIHSRVTLYGGIGRPNADAAVVRFKDIWTFDGTNWTEQKSITTPPARYGAYIEVNPETKRAVMFGGKDEKEKYLNEHWEWDGTKWEQINSASRPSARMNGMLAYDPSRGAMTLFGGYAGGYFSEIWTLLGDSWKIQPEQAPSRRRPVSN